MSRRNFFIRAIATIAGDLAAGCAMASACTWVIQAAAVGLFMSFVLWLMALVASLALSQFVVHPITTTLLSDHKLDEGAAALSRVLHSSAGVAADVWQWAQALRPERVRYARAR